MQSYSAVIHDTIQGIPGSTRFLRKMYMSVAAQNSCSSDMLSQLQHNDAGDASNLQTELPGLVNMTFKMEIIMFPHCWHEHTTGSILWTIQMNKPCVYPLNRTRRNFNCQVMLTLCNHASCSIICPLEKMFSLQTPAWRIISVVRDKRLLLQT